MPNQIAATPVAALVIDRAGLIASADAEAERLTGHASAQLAGQTMATALVVTADRQAVTHALEALPVGGVMGLELRLVRRDGATLPAELTLADGARMGAAGSVLATVRDLTAQRLAEQVAIAGQAVSGAIARSDSPEQATRALLAALGQQLGWSSGTFWTQDSGGMLRAIAAWPHDPAEDGVAGALPARTRRTGAAEWTDDGDPQAGLAVPVRRGGLLVGVLELRQTGRREADPAVAEALTIAGSQIGELLGVLEDRFSLMSSLTRLALTDQLTGLPNRRAWEDALRRELARARRGGDPVCVAVLDLDQFKVFNDEHGHQAGDRILAAAAENWQAQLRVTDVLARYGGEEFAAVIPAWPMDRAFDVVERLRRATPGDLTASAGLASWNGEESGASLFGRADAALYAAKQQGRDRTVVAAVPATDRGDETTAPTGGGDETAAPEAAH